MPEIARLPPIRQLLKPDPGYTLIDCDLEKADVHFVAWEANARRLKEILKSGQDLHNANAKLMGCTRQKAKAGVHAVDYYCKARTLAQTLGCSVEEAEQFIRSYFRINPEIPEWHRKTRREIQFKRQIRNIFGFRRFYFDRLRPGNDDDINRILPQALAWLGSSPVSVVINRGMKQLDCARQLVGQKRCGQCLECERPGTIRLKLQVHDSALFEVPTDLCPGIFPELLKRMRVTVPYDDPLTIPVSMKFSDRSWGEAKEWKPVLQAAA